jgi:hypothetical protein
MYKQKFQQLLEQCGRVGISVILLFDNELKDYAALHTIIGRQMGFTLDGNEMPDDTIYLDGNFSRGGKHKVRYQNLKHEIVEMNLMKQGMNYWEAHLISLEKEKEECVS